MPGTRRELRIVGKEDEVALHTHNTCGCQKERDAELALSRFVDTRENTKLRQTTTRVGSCV